MTLIVDLGQMTSAGRQPDGERGAAARLALDLDAAVVAIDDPFREAQAEARSFGRRGSRGVDAVKPLEQVRQRVSRNAGAVVLHIEPRASVLARDADADVAT